MPEPTKQLLPEIIVFAGPNGSGKSTINVHRVKVRHDNGGHDVPEEKIRSRYARCLKLIPALVSVSDVFHLYDNTDTPFRIFKKRKTEFFFGENEFWNKEKIERLTGVSDSQEV